jgi:hypothetical protein
MAWLSEPALETNLGPNLTYLLGIFCISPCILSLGKPSTHVPGEPDRTEFAHSKAP